MRTRENKIRWQDRVAMRSGRSGANLKTYVTARMTREQIEAKRAQIQDQQELFNLEVTMLEEAKALRDTVLAYLDESVTLDEFIDEMMANGLCQRIGVWASKKN